MPLYTLRHKTRAKTVQTTDPGRALISGKWSDIGRFKGPILRGLASRAPYFHNGLAKDLPEAVEFYDTRFGMGMTVEEKARLGGVSANAFDATTCHHGYITSSFVPRFAISEMGGSALMVRAVIRSL